MLRQKLHVHERATPRLVDALVAWGDIEAIAGRVRAHHEAGADRVAVQVVRGDRAIPLGEWRELSRALV